MLVLWALNRNSSLTNILDKPASSALTFKINFEESENFATENHGAQATILSFTLIETPANSGKKHSFFFLIHPANIY